MNTKETGPARGNGPGHAENPAKGLGAVPTIPHHTDRIPRCRLLDDNLNRCTAEVAEVDGEIALCPHHLALAVAMVKCRFDAALLIARWSA